MTGAPASRYLAIATMVLAVGTVAAQQSVPTISQHLPPTNQFKYFGYFHTDGRVGDVNNETNPYTNTYVAYMCHYDSGLYPDGCSASEFATSLNNAINVYGYKYIFLRLVRMSETNIDAAIETARPYWSKVAFLEVIHEPLLESEKTAPYTQNTIDGINALLVQKNLAAKPMGGVWTISDINNTNYTFLSATNLEWVGVEAYAAAPGSDGDAAAVTAQLIQAKSRVPADKDIVMVTQAYNYGDGVAAGYTNETELIRLQDSPYLQAYNDARVTGIVMFAYGRGGPNPPGVLIPEEGGTQDLPHVKLRHVKQAEAIRPPDFNGDYHPDLVWRNTSTGENAFWLMNGVTRGATPPFLSAADQAWEIRAVGDLNGDAKPDVIWQHAANGGIAAWLFDGTILSATIFLTPSAEPDLAWKIVGLGDMDRDGRQDLVWRREGTGELRIWHMSGLTRRDSVGVINALQQPVVAPDPWQIEGVGDMNGDSYPDFIWRHGGDGRLASWYMKDGTLSATPYLLNSQGAPIAVADVTWRIAGVADIARNGVRDGKPDLVWQRDGAASNNVAVWYMNGITVSLTIFMDPPHMTDPNWRMVGVK